MGEIFFSKVQDLIKQSGSCSPGPYEESGVYLPKEFTEHSRGELRVLPAAESKELHGLLRVATVFDDLLYVARPHKQDLCH